MKTKPLIPVRCIFIVIIFFKIFASVFMFWGSDLFNILSTFSIYSIPYIFARAYSASSNEFIYLFSLLIIVVVGWLITLIFIFLKNKTYISLILTTILVLIDSYFIISSTVYDINTSKIIALLFNFSVLLFTFFYFILLQKSKAYK